MYIKFSFFSIFVLIWAFVSCTDRKNLIISEHDDNTLKNQSMQKLLTVDWSDEIESNRLEGNIKERDDVSKRIKLNSSVILASHSQSEVKSVYPAVEGFGSLDTSDMDSLLYETVCSFCETFMKGDDVDSYFVSKNKFNLALFNYDFDKIKNEILKDKEDDYVLFSKRLIGQCVVAEDVYQVPVRFYGNDFLLDIYCYFVKESNIYKVEQIQTLSYSVIEGDDE